eukprot:1159991-Prorocentrum_minimum.AAC.1
MLMLGGMDSNPPPTLISTPARPPRIRHRHPPTADPRAAALRCPPDWSSWRGRPPTHLPPPAARGSAARGSLAGNNRNYPLVPPLIGPRP